MGLRKNDWLAIFFLLLVSLLGIKALFQPGFYTSHDGEHQLIRLNHFLLGLKDGQFPVRWAGLPAFDGFGYPLFIFTYRFPFCLASLFRFTGFSLVGSVKAVFIVSYVFSGILMYLVQKKIWQDNLAALIGALFYLWAPWRFSTILVRASLGEAVCFLFFPLVIWSIFSLQAKENKKMILLGAFSLACLLLSHALLTFLFLPFLVILMAFFLWQSKARKKLAFDYFRLLFFSAGLSAYYWLPALVEKKITVFADVLTGFYQQHFPTLRQLLYSPWGYGLSHPGVEQDAMSFQVGIGQWLVVLFATLGLFWWQIRKKRLAFSEKMTGLFIVFFLATIFLTISSSKPYWQWLSRFLIIDFPFRYLALATLFSSLIAGGLMVMVKKDQFLRLFLYLLAFGLVFLIFYGNRNHLRVNQYLNFPDSHYENHPSSGNSFAEYRPRWVEPKHFPQREETMVVEKGEAEIISEEINSYGQRFRIETEQKSLLRLNTIYYPGWKLWIDGKEEKIDRAELTGLMEFSLPPGRHEVVFKFTRTWDRIIGEAISLVFLVFMVCQAGKSWRKENLK